jgi:serine protease AprX
MDVLLPDRRVAADPQHPGVVEYYEMSGTSMASPIVAATAALMIEQDPSLTPASVKARLRMSARKPKFGDPLVSGAGYLDILGALRADWTAANALSPRALPNVPAGRIGFENTAVLWGSPAFSLRALWANSVAWSDPDDHTTPVLQTDGEIWPPGGNGGNGEIWPDSECWPEGEMWPDSPLWTPNVTNAEQAGPYMTEALASGFRDP